MEFAEIKSTEWWPYIAEKQLLNVYSVVSKAIPN